MKIFPDNKPKIAVFDIDGVLNEHGNRILQPSIEAIEQLSHNGIRCVYCSGKGAEYIRGLLVGGGLYNKKDNIIISENGGILHELDTHRILKYDKHLKELKRFKDDLEKRIENRDGLSFLNGFQVWEEPKETAYTLFPNDANEYPPEKMCKFMEQIALDYPNIYLIDHVDAVDVLQKGLDKKHGLEQLTKLTGVKGKDMVCFVDGKNDIPMVEYVGFPIAVANAHKDVKALVNGKRGFISSQEFGYGVKEAVNNMLKQYQ